MPRDDEMLVRSVRVHAGRGLRNVPGRSGIRGATNSRIWSISAGLTLRSTVPGVQAWPPGRSDLGPRRQARRWDRRTRESRRTGGRRRLPRCRSDAGRPGIGPRRWTAGTVLHLALGRRRARPDRPAVPVPNAPVADDQLARGVRGGRRAHLDPVAARGHPARHRLLEVQLGPGTWRPGPGGPRPTLRGSPVRRPARTARSRPAPGAMVGKAAADLRRFEQLVRQAPLLRAAQASGHGAAVRPAIITPPVRCTIVRPEAASTSGHSSAARSNSGT